MIAFVVWTMFVFVSGYVVRWITERRRTHRAPKPRPLPLARVLSRVEERRLEIPTVHRVETLRRLVFCKPTRIAVDSEARSNG